MITKICFEGYKGFKNYNELELKPITILLGKNSSGKSAIAKLPVLLEECLNSHHEIPILHSYKGIELGAEFRDLLYNKDIQGDLKFELFNNNNESIQVQINNEPSTNSPIISKWKFVNSEKPIEINPFSKTAVTTVFNGIFPVEMKPALSEKFKLDTNYLGPFRLNPPRIFYLKGNKVYNRIGNKGENAYEILANSFENKDDLVKKVGDWYYENFDGWRLTVKKNSPYFEIQISRDGYNSDGEINIVDVGQGMSQALPIIVKAYLEAKPSLVIIEQPELHLHPAAHSSLAELIASTQKINSDRYLIETHSENFILRLRRMVAENRLDISDLAIYSVEYDAIERYSFLKRINVDKFGEVDYWPKDIFMESFEEVKALRKAQSTK
jgi:predicted ATPase